MPEIIVEEMIFIDSTEIRVVPSHKGGKIMMEIGSGDAAFYTEVDGPFYVKKTKTLRFKERHPKHPDSQVSSVKVFQLSDLELEIKGDHSKLSDKKRGSQDLEDLDWMKVKSDKVIFQFKTQNKKLEEVELLSYVKTSKHILPPKKVVLYAHLKNGKKEHIRTSNTIGKFRDTETYWSHTLRLSGKPKLKKTLKKTVFFSLEVTPYLEGGKAQKICLDELLIR